MNPAVRTLILWIAILVVVIVLWNTFHAGRVTRHPLTFTDFLERVEDGQIEEVTIRDQEITGKFKEGGEFPAGDQFSTYAAEYPDLVENLIEQGVVIKAEKPRENPLNPR